MDGQVNGPLIAYYYALYGGRKLYEQEGQKWLTDSFKSNPGRFIQEMGVLVDTMEEMHRQYQASGGRFGRGTFWPKSSMAKRYSSIRESKSTNATTSRSAC